MKVVNVWKFVQKLVQKLVQQAEHRCEHRTAAVCDHSDAERNVHCWKVTKYFYSFQILVLVHFLLLYSSTALYSALVTSYFADLDH